jgi:uncharacterized membrane protein HdeD (DUF308 family)
MAGARAASPTPYRTLDHFSWSQLARGFVLVQFGVAAINWPETVLPVSMALAGLLVALSGAYDVTLGIRGRRALRAWPLLAGHGAACVAFGALTVGMLHVPLSTAMTLVALWLVLYGATTGALALALWPMRRTRWALLVVTATVIPLGLGAPLLVDLPEFVPLYLGAFFSVFLGVLHLAGGLWLRRVALPQFAPTVQAEWGPIARPP